MSIKILTIDDSKTIRLIVARALKPFNCVVLEGANGLEGLAVASREKPDLIILDYTMPMMDGFEVLARLRSDQDLKNTPVIMLTAEAGRETVVKIAKLGVRDYLIKPFKDELLIERIGRVLTLKAKTDEVERTKRFDDALNILLVDDKPAIAEQIKAGFVDTKWNLIIADQPGQALDACMKQTVDLVLASLSLPQEGAYLLFQNLRGFAATSGVPVIGLCVKTDAEGQTRAQRAGFASIITKPIDIEELKTRVCRTLRLETSYKYFQQQNKALVIVLPKDINHTVTHEISTGLPGKLTATVDAGANNVIIDMNLVEKADLAVIDLVLSVLKACNEYSLTHAIVASDSLKAEFKSYEEAQQWSFIPSLDAALADAR